MIRKNLLNFKLNLPKNSLKNHFESFMANFNPVFERCPSCGAKGQCKKWAYYDRGVVEVINGNPYFWHIHILRVKCSCGHTHAIIPDFLIPYIQFSLPFVLYILKIYFSRSMKVYQILDSFDISHATLYRWKAAFMKHKSWWVDYIRLSKTSSLGFLDELLEYNPFSDFTMGFYRKTLFSFHQVHANPANCRHLPPGWPPPEVAATRHVHGNSSPGVL